MITIIPIGENCEEKIKNAFEQVEYFINHKANYSTEDFGIGPYEYGGCIGYDSNIATIYDDICEFEIDLSPSEIPANYDRPEYFWSEIDLVKVYTNYDEQLLIAPKFSNNKFMLVIEGAI